MELGRLHKPLRGRASARGCVAVPKVTSTFLNLIAFGLLHFTYPRDRDASIEEERQENAEEEVARLLSTQESGGFGAAASVPPTGEAAKNA